MRCSYFPFFRCFLCWWFFLFWWRCCYYINYNIISVWRCCFYIFRVGGGFLLLHRGGGSCRCYFYKKFTLFLSPLLFMLFFYFLLFYIYFIILILYFYAKFWFLSTRKTIAVCGCCSRFRFLYCLQVVLNFLNFNIINK